MLFYSNDIVTMQDIAKKIHRNKSTVTTLVNKLVKLGYVKKSKDLDDSRTTIISLTKKGWELKPIFDEISEKLLSKIYTNFTNEQQKEVIDALEKINKNL
jgi:DNA-binding MarR family transcriptional regulator